MERRWGGGLDFAGWVAGWEGGWRLDAWRVGLAGWEGSWVGRWMRGGLGGLAGVGVKGKGWVCGVVRWAGGWKGGGSDTLHWFCAEPSPSCQPFNSILHTLQAHPPPV